MSWDVIGIGAVASIGRDPHEIFAALCQGRSGLAKLRAFDLSRFRAHHAYEIDDREEPGRDEPGRATRWLRTAIAQALDGAGLPHDLTETPVLVGTTFREQRSAELWWRDGVPLTPDDLHFGPALREAFGSVATYTPASACAASLYGLGMAADLIDLELADTVVVAGTDAIPESAFGMIDRVQNRTPEALRPLDKARRGMLMGEGAVAVVLRRRDMHPGPARARARVRSVGMNCDGHHPTRPSRQSIAAVIRDAHQRAGTAPADIDLVMLHGTGTRLNDETEIAALTDVFTGHRPYLTAIKSMTGHTCGGSGLLSLVMAVLALEQGVVPPILGLTDPIDEAAGFGLPAPDPVPADLATAQVDAFGFGGLNAVAVLERVVG